MQIIPSILEKNILDIKEKIEKIENLVQWVQIDVCDGEFASPATWPFTESNPDSAVHELKDIMTKINIELHLMTLRPEEILDEWIDTPVKRIFIHHEATSKEELDLTVLDMSTTQSGLALNLETPVDVVDEFIAHIDDIQLMSIAKIGQQGALFDERVMNKIKQLRKRYPKVKISVDGGINESNIKSIRDAGADNAVVGSAIWKSAEPAVTIENLKRLVN